MAVGERKLKDWGVYLKRECLFTSVYINCVFCGIVEVTEMKLQLFSVWNQVRCSDESCDFVEKGLLDK